MTMAPTATSQAGFYETLLTAAGCDGGAGGGGGMDMPAHKRDGDTAAAPPSAVPAPAPAGAWQCLKDLSGEALLNASNAVRMMNPALAMR